MKALFAIAFLLVGSTASAAHLFQGSREAKVQILIYGDYECPYTARLMEDLPKWQSKYGDSIGVSFAHFPLSFHENAYSAATAAVCAERQGAFAAYSRRLFAQQRSLGHSAYVAMARAEGLNAAKFERCLTESSVSTMVDNDYVTGLAVGVTGTPNVFINGERVNGAYPTEHFEEIFDRLLKAN